MIIDSNSNNNKLGKNFLNRTNDNFNTKFKQYKQNSQIETNNIFVKDIKQQKYTNVNSQDEMYNKSLAILNDRLKNGLITLKEFEHQVKELAKKRK